MIKEKEELGCKVRFGSFPQEMGDSGSAESFCCEPISMTLVLLGWMAIVCRCDLTVLMDVPDFTKVVSST